MKKLDLDMLTEIALDAVKRANTNRKMMIWVTEEGLKQMDKTISKELNIEYVEKEYTQGMYLLSTESPFVQPYTGFKIDRDDNISDNQNILMSK